MVRIANHHQRNSSSNQCVPQLYRHTLRFRLLVVTVGVGTIITMVKLLQLSFQFPQQQLEGTTTSLLEQHLRFDLRGIHYNKINIKNDQPESRNIQDGAVAEGLNSKLSNANKVHENSEGKSSSSTGSTLSTHHEANQHLTTSSSCPYMKLTDLTETERYPKKSITRHMVSPPMDGNVTLVCCQTTAGPWNIMVHTNWAPIGAQRFLDMVRNKYFDTTVPLMRCIQNFICQFGLNGVPAAMKPYIGKNTLLDDPNWLPEGPNHRMDPITKVKRFNRGYLAYAGAGKHSRDIQFIVALQDNGPLAGGSPWEVPWGELVGNHSYDTLSKIYTGYGENGPSQGMLHKANALTVVKEKYPLLDYIQTCYISDSEYTSVSSNK